MFNDLVKLLVENNIPFLVIPEENGCVRITFDCANVVIKSNGTGFLTTGEYEVSKVYNELNNNEESKHPVRILSNKKEVRKEYGKGDAKDLISDYLKLTTIIK
jgi:hypothetical protein